jgi:hypothetical protein
MQFEALFHESLQINEATAALILNALARSDWSVAQLVLYFNTH